MKCNSYFSQTLKGNCSPHLSQDMFALYLNILHLEGRIPQLNDLLSKGNRMTKSLFTSLKLTL